MTFHARKAAGAGSKSDALTTDAQLSPSLYARALSAGYRPKPHPPQIDDISLALVPGELTAIIGPNGSGKSTLLRCLSRTLAPSRGAVLLGDSDLYAALSPRESAQAIAVVPQSTDVFLDFTVRDIVAMGRAPHRASRGLLAPDTPADEAAVGHALARAGIDSTLAARPISQVSGGERQRALIARCLAQGSPILLLDEPVSALDARHQRHLLNWLRELAVREHRSVIVVLHDLNAAAEFAERIIVLSEGRVVADGNAGEVLTAELIHRVYGVRAWIRSNPATGRLCVLPAEPLAEIADFGQSGITHLEDAPATDKSLSGVRIHLYCAGAGGAALMFALAPLGASLSCCALHDGDVALEAARALGVRHALAPAFSRPTPDAVDLASSLADEAQAAVFIGMKRGEINGDLFEQAAAFAASGRPFICLSEAGAEAFTAAALPPDALASAQFAPNMASVVAALRHHGDRWAAGRRDA